MRDPKRIEQVISELWEYWLAHPDLRLGQIVVNCSRLAAKLDDPFCLEDEEFLKGLYRLREIDRCSLVLTTRRPRTTAVAA